MSQLKRKFIEDNAVNGAKIRLENNELLRGRNNANSADKPILKITAADELEFHTQPQAADALPLPSAPKHYVTVEWAENYLSGKQDPKEAVNVLRMTNLPLTGTTPLVVDGITLTDGDFVALANQTDSTQNGPYVVDIDAGNYTLTRRFDFDQDSEVSAGAYFPVLFGTDHAGWTVILTTTGAIEIGTTELDFVVYPSVLSLTAGDMLNKVGNEFSVDLAMLSGLESTNPGNASGQLRVKTDTAPLEKDRSTVRDPVTGAVIAKKSRRFHRTLDATDITNQYIDLPYVASQDSVRFQPAGAGTQIEDEDYGVNYTGGAGSKTRVTFLGGLASGGVSALVAGDKVVVYYMAFVE